MDLLTQNCHHGGDLQGAVRRYGIARERWLDLSTGISPWGWPVPALPADVWQRLPEVECPLCKPAASYYGCEPQSVLAVPGSQFAIQTLPELLPVGRVAMPRLGYFEHRKAWLAQGHTLVDYPEGDSQALLQLIDAGAVDAAVVINPNNPSAARFDRNALLDAGQTLASREGLLVVDEAFMDSESGHSLAPDCPRPGLVVLRSLGKFFGLAGLRLGFVLADNSIQRQLQTTLGPWGISGPAQWVGLQALTDSGWQRVQRQRIAAAVSQQCQHLRSALAGHRWSITAGPLFVSVRLPDVDARALTDGLGRQGILVRRFDASGEEPACVRFGLVKNEAEARRLAQALQAVLC